MNIRIEKKRYTPPFMEVVKMGNKSCLLSHSRIDDDDDDDDVDIDEIDGYDDEFG